MTMTLSCPLATVDTPAPPPRTPADPLGLELRRPDEDWWAAILPNPSHPARPYKVQYFASFGLAGHQGHVTPAAALAGALADASPRPTPAPWSGSARPRPGGNATTPLPPDPRRPAPYTEC